MFLFGSFRGYVKFFLLQDLMSEDYSAVRFWDGWKDFSDNPIRRRWRGIWSFWRGKWSLWGGGVGELASKLKKMIIDKIVCV